MKLEIPDGSINSLQLRSIRELLQSARGMHHADVVVRINGQDVGFQADWLRHAVILEAPAIETPREATQPLGKNLDD